MASLIPAASCAVFIPLDEQRSEDLAFMRLALDQVRPALVACCLAERRS